MTTVIEQISTEARERDRAKLGLALATGVLGLCLGFLGGAGLTYIADGQSFASAAFGALRAPVHPSKAAAAAESGALSVSDEQAAEADDPVIGNHREEDDVSGIPIAAAYTKETLRAAVVGSTKEQVVALLGPPVSVTDLGSGAEAYQYEDRVRVVDPVTGLRGNWVVIEFGVLGKAVDVSVNS